MIATRRRRRHLWRRALHLRRADARRRHRIPDRDGRRVRPGRSAGAARAGLPDAAGWKRAPGSDRVSVAARSLGRSSATLARSSLLGIILGIIPGAGATIASFVAYGIEAQYGKRREELGSGIAEGIVAPQTASTATVARPHGAAAHARHSGQRRDGGDPRRIPAARHAAGAAGLHQESGAGLRDLRLAVPRRDRHVPDGLFRDQAADQGALPARGGHLGVRRDVLFHRRLRGAQQHHRPVDDRRVRHRRLPVREIPVPDRADGARLHPRHAGREARS